MSMCMWLFDPFMPGLGIQCITSCGRCVVHADLVQVLLEAGAGFVTIVGAEGATADSAEGDDGVHITLDRTKILSVGMPAIKSFLNTIQVWRM